MRDLILQTQPQNKTLIVALGDSWCAGVGAYEPQALAAHLRGEISAQTLFDLSVDSFAEHSWPAQLAKLANCDVINLGVAGGSNLGASRLLYAVDPKTFDCYNRVIVIQMITEPARISFYSQHQVRNYTPNHSQDSIMHSYLRTVMHDTWDTELEAVFALNTVNNYCRANGFEFYYASAFYHLNKKFLAQLALPQQNFHHNTPYNCVQTLVQKPQYQSSTGCAHPNQLGYQLIAEHMYTTMHTNNWI